MTAPLYRCVSTPVTDAGGTWTISATGATPITLDDIVIFQVLQDGPTANAVTVSSFSFVCDLANNAGAMDYLGAFPVSGVPDALQHLWIGRMHTGTSAPSATGNNTTSEDLYGRWYFFNNGSAGTTLATVIENGVAGAVSQSAGNSNEATDAGVTTLGPDRLALNFIAVNDDNAIAVFAGQTGGAWGLLVSPYAESSGTDGAIAIQVGYTGVGNVVGGTAATTILGPGGANEEAAQSFLTPSAGLTVQTIVASASVANSPSQVICEIQTDNSGFPSGTAVASVTVDVSGWDGSNRFRYIPLSATLSGSTTYWLVFRLSERVSGNYISWFYGAANSYADGFPATKASGVWSGSGASNDFVFAVGLSAGTIDGGAASVTDPDAWGVVGFALIGTTVVAAAKSLLVPHRHRGLIVR